MKKYSVNSILALITAVALTLTGFSATAAGEQTTTDFTDGLCLYYDFEGEGDAVWSDKAGDFDLRPAKNNDAGDGRVYEGVTATVSGGKTEFGNAADLPIQDGYLAIPDGFMDTIGAADATISFWFKGTDAMADYQTVLAFGDDELKKKITFHATGDSGNPLCVWMMDKNDQEFRLMQAESPVASNDGWHLYTLTITRSEAADSIVFYVDGSKKAEKADVKLPNYTSGTVNKWNQIGCSWWNEKPTGQVDEVRVYNKALTAESVAELVDYVGKGTEGGEDEGGQETPDEQVDLSSDLLYHFSFDFDNVGRDSVSRKNLLEETGAIGRETTGGPMDGKYGKYATFDGIFTYGLINDNVLDGVSSEMSVSLWVKPEAIRPYVRLFDVGTGTKFFYILVNNSDDPEWGRLEAGITTDGWFGQPGTTFTSAWNEEKVIKKGEWTHVAVTVKDNKLIVYVNGEELCSTTTVVDFSDIGEATENYIGMSRFTQDALFEGAMDEIRVYKRGLNASEVQALSAGNTPENPDDGTAGSPETGEAGSVAGVMMLGFAAMASMAVTFRKKR